MNVPVSLHATHSPAGWQIVVAALKKDLEFTSLHMHLLVVVRSCDTAPGTLSQNDSRKFGRGASHLVLSGMACRGPHFIDVDFLGVPVSGVSLPSWPRSSSSPSHATRYDKHDDVQNGNVGEEKGRR